MSGNDPAEAGVYGTSATLNFTEPVGIVLFGMLHFLDDSTGPHRLFDQYLNAIPAGSCIAVSHLAKDETDAAMNDTLVALDRQFGEGSSGAGTVESPLRRQTHGGIGEKARGRRVGAIPGTAAPDLHIALICGPPPSGWRLAEEFASINDPQTRLDQPAKHDDK